MIKPVGNINLNLKKENVKAIVVTNKMTGL
jgi:hypothetical protein